MAIVQKGAWTSARRVVSGAAEPWAYVGLFLLSALFSFPFLWTLLTAFKSPQEIFLFPPPLWPEQFL
jgi:ABC-type glycerol-3-phosphate transport system permease component